MKKLYCRILIVFLATTQISVAQTILKGIVKEKQGDAELLLPFANVFLEGTTTGTTTNYDGEFTMLVQAGIYQLSFSFIGYQKVTKEVQCSGEGEMSFEVVLSGGGEQLKEVKVEARINRESESMLLMEQKKAVVAVEAIGARQLSIQGVSDAADAATKITGISKQEGSKSLSIRGLGDRYNTSTLNGLPLPSNNAETKNIDLELLSTDIVGFVGVNKVASGAMSGDFAGANINVGSKKFTGDPFFSLGLKSGANSSVVGLDEFLLQDGYGMFGFDNTQAPSNLKTYNFKGGWNPENRAVSPNMGLTISGGRAFSLNSGELNTFVSLSHENEYAYSDYLERRINGGGTIRKDLTGKKYNFETQTTALLNLNYSKENSDIYWNSMLLNTSDQMFRKVNGFLFDLAEEGAYIFRGDYERTRVLVNQLLGEHSLNDRSDLSWGVSYNNVLNVIPDRRHLTFNDYDETTNTAHFTNDNESDYFRYFHQFIENEVAANVSFQKRYGKKTGDSDYRMKLTAGYAGKFKLRNFESTQFNHEIYHQGRDPFAPNYFVYVDVDNVDAFLNDANLAYANNGGQIEKDGEFFLKTFFGKNVRPSTYDGILMTNAAFGQLEYNLSERLVALFAARYEYVFQQVEYSTSLKPEGGSRSFNESKFLPSLSMKYALNQKSNLRLAASKTYTLPMFTEMALFAFEGITETTVGNPNIYPSDIYNIDLKWELFPKAGESITFATFGKQILNPMNKFVMTSASNDFTYANTGDWAYAYGLEVDIKNDLVNIRTKDGNKKLFIAANLTIMTTLQELDGAKIAKESGSDRINADFNTSTEALQGAAPVLANATLGYKNQWDNGAKDLTASIVYSYVSDRLYLIGTGTFGNQIDKEIHSLDVVLKSNLGKWGASIKAKNLLNPSFDRIQENRLEHNPNYGIVEGASEFNSNAYLVQSYKRGIQLSMSISYKIN